MSISAEIEPFVVDGRQSGWRLTLFVDQVEIAEATGDTVPEAAAWCVHRMERNLQRGRDALISMGLVKR